MFFDSQLNEILFKQLDAASLRQKVISDNIANINTPNFKKSEVHFKDQLKNALNDGSSGMLTTDGRHLPSSSPENLKPRIVEIDNTRMREGGNNVDLDQQMVNLSKNTMLYQTTAQALSKKKSIMNEVVKGGN